MAENASRKYTQVIDYVEDEVGVDIPRDVKRAAIAEIDSPSNPLPSNIDEIGGQVQSAVDVADQISKIQSILAGQTLTVTDDGALNIAGVVSVQEDTPVDVSAAEVDVDLNSQTLGSLSITDDGSLVLDASSQGTLPVEQQTPVTIEADDDAGNTASLQAEELGTALGGVETALVTKLAEALSTVANAQLRVDLQNNNAGTLPTEQQTPVGVEDSAGSQVDPLDQSEASPLTGTATTAGSASAISFDLGDLRTDVDFYYDVAINGRLEVEVSTDGATWRTLQTIDTADSNIPQSDIAQFGTAYQYIRFYANGADFADADVNQLEASAKGVN